MQHGKYRFVVGFLVVPLVLYGVFALVRANKVFDSTRWVALVAVLPVLAIGGGLKQLETPTAVMATLVTLAFVYFLFRVHRREWLGGPGPLEIHPRPDPEKPAPEKRAPETRKGRPPSS